MNEPTKEHPIIATSSRITYENPWIRIREDKTLRKGNKEGIYGVVEINDSVATCAINEDNELFLVWGYHYPTDTWSWQIPGGGGDKEPPLVAAARELQEETGIVAGNLEQLSNLIVTGILSERMAVVVATELKMGERTQSDDDDSVTMGKFFALSVVKDMILRGDVCDSQSIAAVYMVEKWLAQ